MNEWTIVAVALALAVSVSSMLAWDFGRRWLTEKAALRASNDVLNAVLKRQDDNELVLKRLAEDWMKKFVQLENDWRKLKEHADSQFAGAIAQVHPGQTRGFGR